MFHYYSLALKRTRLNSSRFTAVSADIKHRSMENAVFGGATIPLIFDPRESELKEGDEAETRLGFPHIGLNLFPPLHIDNYETVKTRRNTEQWLIHEQKYEVSPIPLYWYEEIQQDDFWNVYISAYGGDLLKPRALWSGVHKRLKNMTRTFYRYAHIDYKGLLAKTMDIQHKQQWWTDNANFNDAVGLAYKRRRLEREKSIALKFKLSRYEDERHAAIRKRNATRLDTCEVEKYKKAREKAKAAYDKKRIEEYRLAEAAKAALGVDSSDSDWTVSDSDLEDEGENEAEDLDDTGEDGNESEWSVSENEE